MKALTIFLVSLAMGMSLNLFVVDDAEAKRMGGGRSFGGSSRYSSPAKRATPSRQSTAPATPAQQRNANLKQSFANRGGLMGMLGGLAIGGMLGALFFGGAFENINFFDILILAGIAFLIYKLIAARRRRSEAQTVMAGGAGGMSAARTAGGDYQQRPSMAGQRKFNTDLLFKGKSGATAGAQPQQASERPAGFDERSFMRGAEQAYRQLQASWDKGDLTDIRNLTTDAVFEELKSQLQERRGENRTDVLKLRTQLLEVKEEAGQWQATVLYDALLREVDEASGTSPSPESVRELWHFIRPARSDQPTWFLDGIQQLEG